MWTLTGEQQLCPVVQSSRQRSVSTASHPCSLMFHLHTQLYCRLHFPMFTVKISSFRGSFLILTHWDQGFFHIFVFGVLVAVSVLTAGSGEEVTLELGEGGGASATVVVFLRHFLCPPCHAFARGMGKEWTRRWGKHTEEQPLAQVGQQASGGPVGPKDIRLIAIGCGGPRAAQKWAELFRFPGEVYTAPNLEAYRQFQLNYGSPKVGCGTYCLRFTKGLCTALYTIICRCGCALSSEMGDVDQQSGVFVFKSDGAVTFEFRATDYDQYPEPRTVLDAAVSATSNNN
eukprot:m.60387 g.60387  ORF g.60387 m.60387 type:complete len:287 (+) comp9504_c0_seq1:2206-3066(+)